MRIREILAGAAAAAPLVACAFGGSAAPRAWQPEEFPIGYWCGPPPANNSLVTWQTVKRCNFTFCGPAGGYSVAENLRMLDFCKQAGLKAMVVDGRFSWQMVALDDWKDRIGRAVADYGAHPALYGYFLQDEPNFKIFEALGQVSRELHRQDPKHLPYINLFPTYASAEQLGNPSYADHIEKFLTITKPAVLSYDHYCLQKDGTDRGDYFENLSLVREHGLRHGVPPWNIILSIPHFGYRDPTAAEMRWQVYTSLAYGMKGIMYFTYWTIPAWEKDGATAIVDSCGKPARLFPIVQQLNAEMGILGKTLLRLTSTGVFHTGEIPQGCVRLGGDAILRPTREVPLVIGFFRDSAGDEFAMIANRSHSTPVEAEMTARPHVTGLVEISRNAAGGEELRLAGNKVRLRLDAGDGRLFRLKTAFRYPYPVKPLTAIDFGFERDEETEGWEAFSSLDAPVVKGGVMTLVFSGEDPHMTRGFLRVGPDACSRIRIRMRLASGQPVAQLFWTTSEDPQFSDRMYMNFPVKPDGEWHEYEVLVGAHEQWRGKAIRAIRLDPTTGGAKAGDNVEIDWIVGE